MNGESNAGGAPLVNGSLPRQLTGFGSPILWGVLLLVVIEAVVHASFVVSYFYLRLGTEVWPPEGVPLPGLFHSSLSQALLVGSVVPVAVVLRTLRYGRAGIVMGLPVGLALAAVYLALKVKELTGKPYRWDAHAYGSLDWSMAVYGAMHVATVLLAGVVIWVLALRGHFGRTRYTGVQGLALYWVFVVVASLLFYVTQSLSPYLL